MAFFSFLQYLKYRWEARGRHGTHSPFVYEFVEGVLRDYEVIPREYIVSVPELPLRYENILSRTAAYYGLKVIVHLPATGVSVPGNDIDMLVLHDGAYKEWLSMYRQYSQGIGEHSVVAVLGINNTRDNAATWKMLRNEPGVKMSIDIFGMGFLLFREEFKVRQDFVLR